MLNHILIASICVVCYTIGLAIYRLKFHPLARFPGPKLTAATQWWEFYIDVIRNGGGRFWREVERMHEAYGPIVRINPHELHIEDSTWVNILYSGSGQVRDKYPPAAHIGGVPEGVFGTIDHNTHRQRRSALKTFVSKGTVRNSQQGIHSITQHLCRELYKHQQRQDTLDLGVLYLAWSTDSIAQYLEGQPFGLLNDKERAAEWARTLDTVVELVPLIKQIPSVMPLALRLPLWLVQTISPALGRVLKLHEVSF